MAQISLQTRIVYGPVFSRRLGRSFGINLLPTKYKACSFDCVYCQYGSTSRGTLLPHLEDLPIADAVLEAVEKALRKPRSLDVLTFSGNGEPTIHPDFLEIVQGVRDIRDHSEPNVKLALLSNTSRVMNPEILKAIEIMDAPMTKLDAGDQRTFQAINLPVDNIKLSKIIKGLKQIRRLIIQSVLIEGPVSNISGTAFQSWVGALIEINPKEVHIYSTERPTAEENVVTVNGRKLKQIEWDLIGYYGLRGRAFWSD